MFNIIFSIKTQIHIKCILSFIIWDRNFLVSLNIIVIYEIFIRRLNKEITLLTFYTRSMTNVACHTLKEDINRNIMKNNLNCRSWPIKCLRC